MQKLKLISALALICGCASLRPKPEDPGLFLLPPAGAGFSATLTQAVTLQKGKTSTEVIAGVEISPESLKLAVLGPLGNRMLSLIWDGKKLKQERDPSLPGDFPAELILRDLQLAYWTLASVKKGLPANWSLEAGAKQRKILKDGAEVILIRYDGDPLKDSIHFEHKSLGYKLLIRQLERNDE